MKNRKIKIVRTGWVPKNENIRGILTVTPDRGWAFSEFELSSVYASKGTVSDWDKISWPPRKVQITIEEISQ